MLATEDRIADQSPIPPLRILAREGGDEVRLGKIVAFEQQGFRGKLGQRIGKTVPEIQPCRVLCPLAIGSIGATCNLGIKWGQW